jgi:hypothetical protein
VAKKVPTFNVSFARIFCMKKVGVKNVGEIEICIVDALSSLHSSASSNYRPLSIELD